MPPDITDLMSGLVDPATVARKPWKSWSALLADKGGLYEALESIKTSTGPGAPSTQLQQWAAHCFLEALEAGPQLFNRGTVLNVETIDTATQRFQADIQVKSFSVLHKDCMWQWRNLLKGDSTDSVKELKPDNWRRRANDMTKEFPLRYALNTKFLKTQIGESGGAEEHWGVTEEASPPAIAEQRIVVELLLARLVPEAAGDPFTKAGRASIQQHYKFVTANMRKEATFDCMMNLRDFPGDHQTLRMGITSTWASYYSAILHHQATDFDSCSGSKGHPSVSMFAHWAPLGPGYEDRVEGPPMGAGGGARCRGVQGGHAAHWGGWRVSH